MDKLVVRGRKRLTGEVSISGAKNAAVAVIPAAVMATGVSVLENLPSIEDVRNICHTIQEMGGKCRFLDKDGEPRGREYSYKTEIPVEVGQIVDVPAPRQSDADSELKTKSVIVSQINVPEEEIATFAGKVKTVVGIHTEDEKED